MSGSATPTPDKLRTYYASKQVAADGDPLPQYTADADCTTILIKDAALNQADGYWDDAIGWFDEQSPTVQLRGAFFHVKESRAVGELDLDGVGLPVAPAAGDKFRLVSGGGFRSSYEIFGMKAGGAFPEFGTVVGTNITGLTIKKLSGRLGEGTLTVFYDQSENLLFIKMDSNPYGVGLSTLGNPTNQHVYANDGQAFARVTIVTANLPGGDQTDTFTLTAPAGTLTPDYEGRETIATANGRTRYRLEVVKNEAGDGGAMVGLNANISKPAGTTTTTAGTLGLIAATLSATNAADWPTRGFWVENTTKNDCRYCNFRSGNSLSMFGVDWATLAFNTGTGEVTAGQTLTDATTGATGVVDQVTVTSGTWGGGDAAGTFLLKAVTGSFGNGNNLQVGGVTKAVAGGNSVKGLRGKTAVNWDAGDTIKPMADTDIGKGTDSSLEFETPATVLTAPAGVTFGTSQIELGHCEDGQLRGLWRREWILAGHQARGDINDDSVYAWT